MKTLGTTLNGKYIVEMDSDEYHEFMNLEASINGMGGYFDFPRSLSGANLAPVFKALNDLATAKHSITTLQSYINNLANYFGKVSLPLKEQQ